MQDRFFFAKMQIPKKWTGEQAYAVVDLLETINAAVWDLHEEKIIEAMHKQNELGQTTRDPPDDIADDIPF